MDLTAQMHKSEFYPLVFNEKNLERIVGLREGLPKELDKTKSYPIIKDKESAQRALDAIAGPVAKLLGADTLPKHLSSVPAPKAYLGIGYTPYVDKDTPFMTKLLRKEQNYFLSLLDGGRMGWPSIAKGLVEAAVIQRYFSPFGRVIPQLLAIQGAFHLHSWGSMVAKVEGMPKPRPFTIMDMDYKTPQLYLKQAPLPNFQCNAAINFAGMLTYLYRPQPNLVEKIVGRKSHTPPLVLGGMSIAATTEIAPSMDEGYKHVAAFWKDSCLRLVEARLRIDTNNHSEETEKITKRWKENPLYMLMERKLVEPGPGHIGAALFYLAEQKHGPDVYKEAFRGDLKRLKDIAL